MTDEELGKRLIPSWSSAATGTSEDYRRLGAAARELLAPPIARMSVEECRALAKRAWAEHKGGVEESLSAVGDAFHRLAQPAARVDEDAGAKRLAFVHLQNSERVGDYDADRLWASFTEPQRNGWRAVAAAKEAGDA